MNENEKINNPRIKIVKCVGAKLSLTWKNALEKYTKTNDRHNFQYTKFSIIDLVLTDEEIFQVHGQNRPVGNLPVVVFILSRDNAISKATEYVKFGFSFRILIFFPF